MSSSASTVKVEEAEKLLDESNFRAWFSLLELNSGLPEGDPGLGASAERMQNMLDRLIYSLITCSGFVCVIRN
jgi:hypothetical protein